MHLKNKDLQVSVELCAFYRLSEMVMKGLVMCKELQHFIPVYVTCASMTVYAVHIH